MFIIGNHHGIKCLWTPLQLEKCNAMLEVNFDIMAHCYDKWKKYNCYCDSFVQWKENDLFIVAD